MGRCISTVMENLEWNMKFGNEEKSFSILNGDHSNESYWEVLSCGAIYYASKMVLTFASVDEILKCDHSNESYWAVLSCGAVYYAVQLASSFCVWMKSESLTIAMKATDQYFPVILVYLWSHEGDPNF